MERCERCGREMLQLPDSQIVICPLHELDRLTDENSALRAENDRLKKAVEDYCKWATELRRRAGM